MLWWKDNIKNAIKSKNNLFIKYIKSNNNTGIRIAIGAIKSSPIKSIANIAVELTLELK